MMKSRMKIILGWLVAIALVTAGVGVWQRQQLTAWYCAWKLQHATPDHLASYVRQFEALGLKGTDALLGLFNSPDETACQNAGQVLLKILQIWAPPDGRRAGALEQMTNAANQFSPVGQRQCLKVIQQLLTEGESSLSLSQVIAKLTAQMKSEPETRITLYDILIQILNSEQNVNDGLIQQAKTCVLTGIKDTSVPVRLAAIRLGVSPALQLHEHLIPLVTAPGIDPAPEVRQLVLLALGEHEKLLSTEDLCQFLRDNNEDVKTVAERALRVRGLNQSQIKLARMMNDTNPSIRAELPAIVLATPEIDSFVWMERLSRDPAPAVRAASARAMGTHGDERLNSLLQQLSEQDKDPTVRHLAKFYWKQ